MLMSIVSSCRIGDPVLTDYIFRRTIWQKNPLADCMPLSDVSGGSRGRACVLPGLALTPSRQAFTIAAAAQRKRRLVE
jgi:hypothetical protein